MYLTIKDFSNKTGLPPSKLRFYDKKGLLEPSVRLDNGYRAYSVEQIHLAKMIDSLRQADIPIQDIKLYCTVNEQEKKRILQTWKVDLDRRMEVLLAAQKYIGGINVENPQTLLLSKWEKEKHLVWQRFEVERKPHPFHAYFRSAKDHLEKHGIECSNQVYIKTDTITDEKIIGEIGFEAIKTIQKMNDESFRFEVVPPTLFAVLQECKADDAFLCFSYIQVVIRYGFQPAGTKLERYSNLSAETFDYLIPLVT
ncbi:MerR family transcriptional regulator [Ornithinibacillus xuwenensis]|uniref:MerR family transcriptional regulator n=1 Tax=Ornithinibacillus xuwenensis TaxID=3144668 RepID=A0ABU9XHW3_9BACI